MITRELSTLFFRLGCVPLHPSVLKRFKQKDNCIDYSLIDTSLDTALEWFYHDTQEDKRIKELLEHDRRFLQDRSCNYTNDPQIIKDWIALEKQKYIEINGRRAYPCDSLRRFPISGINIESTGFRIGMQPVSIDIYPGSLYKHFIEKYDTKGLLNPELRTEFECDDLGPVLETPGFWYQKDAKPIVKLFGAHLACAYTKAVLEHV